MISECSCLFFLSRKFISLIPSQIPQYCWPDTACYCMILHETAWLSCGENLITMMWMSSLLLCVLDHFPLWVNWFEMTLTIWLTVVMIMIEWTSHDHRGSFTQTEIPGGFASWWIHKQVNDILSQTTTKYLTGNGNKAAGSFNPGIFKK